MINKLTIDDVPENLKSVACAIGIDAFRSLIKCAGGTSVYIPSERCIVKPIRDRVIRDCFRGDYMDMAIRFGISDISVRKIVRGKG